MESTQNQNPIESNTSWASRNLIALIITALVVGTTVFVAVYLLLTNSGSADKQLSFIGQTLLPLWGTWIGTVLAFYFGKANFEAATQSYKDAMKTLTPEEKISRLAVKDVMLPVKDIVYLDLTEESDKPIPAIIEYERFKPYNRFAVLDKNMVVKYMIHRGMFYQFLYNSFHSKTESSENKLNSITLKDLLETNDEQFKKTLNRSIGFISIDANLLDAKRVMDATEECFDVFVTQTGKNTEPILGLLTNNRIFQFAKV